MRGAPTQAVGAEAAAKAKPPTKRKPKPETILRKAVVAYLRGAGWFVYYNYGTMGAYPGAADLVAVKDGYVVWIELKAPKGRQSDNQVEFERQIVSHGGRYMIARCVEDVAELVEVGP